LPSELQKELIADQLLKKRLESVISAFLKDLRDELETRQRLVAGRKSGGMGLSYDLVDQIFEVLKSGNLEKKVPSSKFQVPSFKTSDHHELVEFHEPAVPIKLEPVKFKELTSLKSQKILSTSEIEQKKKEEGIKKLRNLEIKSLAQQPMPRVAMVREAPRTQGPQFFDVKHPSNFSNPSIVSPTKEFSLLGLTDLRRGLSPRLFTEKILQKIEDLGRPDYFKRAEAIKSLRQSDLYKQYVVVGKKSLLQGQNVKDYLASVDSQSCMTYEEFEAISEMNQRLRF
jgi:hypothetical protein